MAPDYTQEPYCYFAPPGAVAVTTAALEMARAFASKVARAGSAQVIAFDWAFARSVRERRDAPERDIGPGLDLVSFNARDVPREVLQHVDGVTFAISVPKHVYEANTQRLIDYNETSFSKLVLR